MQDASGIAAEVRGHPSEQELKVDQRRFVRADLLGGKDRVPRIAEAGGTAPVADTVAIGEGDQPVVLLQIGERFGRVGKGRPVPNRLAEADALGLIGFAAPILS